MLNSKAKKIARKAFRPMIQGMLKYYPEAEKEMYNQQRKKITKIPEYSFQGSYLCGLSTYILSQFFKPHFSTQVIRTKFGYGKYLEDHCFILLNNEIIVDPTIRQFLNDPRGKGESLYCKTLFNNKPIFVGSFPKLEIYLDEMIQLNQSTFGKTYLDLDELNFWWSGKQDFSKKANILNDQLRGLSECETNSEKKLVEYLKKNIY